MRGHSRSRVGPKDTLAGRPWVKQPARSIQAQSQRSQRPADFPEFPPLHRATELKVTKDPMPPRHSRRYHEHDVRMVTRRDPLCATTCTRLSMPTEPRQRESVCLGFHSARAPLHSTAPPNPSCSGAPGAARPDSLTFPGAGEMAKSDATYFHRRKAR